VAQSYEFVLEGDSKKATEIWHQYVTENPKDSFGYHQRAHFGVLSGNKELAVDDYSKGFELLPDNLKVKRDTLDLSASVALKTAGGKGRGLFATRDFKQGDTVMPFAGTYVSCLRHDYEYDVQVGDSQVLSLHEPIDRINHSCDPNCGIAHDKFIAIKDIKSGEECTFDYSTTIDDWSLWQITCLCGSKNCRGKIWDFILLEPALQQHYLDLGVTLPYIASKYKKVAC